MFGATGAFVNPGGSTSISGVKCKNALFVEPGDDLQVKYDWLKSSGRDGAMGALSATNRRTLFLSPGKYTLTSTFVLDTDYVDLAGMGVGLDTVVTRATGGSCVQQATGDVILSNFTIATTGISTGDIGFEQADSDNSNSKYLGMYFKGAYSGFSVYGTEDLGGYWENCHAMAHAWRVAENKELKARMLHCISWESAIGELTSAGKYGSSSFGGDEPGADCSGYFYHCYSGDRSFGGCGTFGCNCSGTFIDCIAGDNSFAIRRNFSGTAIRCTAGEKSFGGDDANHSGFDSEFSGVAIDCVAEGEKSFGMGGSVGKCSGEIIRCRVGTTAEYARGQSHSAPIFDLQSSSADASLTTDMDGGDDSNIVLTAIGDLGKDGNGIIFAINLIPGAPSEWSVTYHESYGLYNVVKGASVGNKTANELQTLLEASGDVTAALAITQAGAGTGNIADSFDGVTSGGLQPALFIGNHPPVPSKTTANKTVPAFDNGHTYTNEGAGSVVTWTLPPAIAGMSYRFCRVDFAAGEDVRIDPNGTEHIYLEDGTDVGEGDYRGSDPGVDAYYELTVECFKNGEWRVVNEKGTGASEV